MQVTTNRVGGRGKTCEDERCPKTSVMIWFCVDCDTAYCDECWKFQAPHKPGKVGRDGIEHEKANFRVMQVYHRILHPPNSARDLEELHHADTDTLWFGRKPMLFEYTAF